MSNVIQFVAKKKSEPEHEAKHSWRVGAVSVCIVVFGNKEYGVSISIHAGKHRTVLVRRTGYNLKMVKANAFKYARSMKLTLAIHTKNSDYVHNHYTRLINTNARHRKRIEKFTDPVERAQYLKINEKKTREYALSYKADLEAIAAN